MDKELLRIVIVLSGLLVMIGMVLWHFIKTLRQHQYGDDADDTNEADYASHNDLDDEFEHPGFDEQEPVEGDGLLKNTDLKPAKPVTIDKPSVAHVHKPATLNELPKLIEISVISQDPHGFNGAQLLEAFERVGLEYGSVRVFERVDQYRMVHFAVASQTNSGIFPETGLDEFYCPGIVFFLQPREVEKPLQVFEDYIDTIDLLATELNGITLDKQKMPLTAETIDNIRQTLVKHT